MTVRVRIAPSPTGNLHIGTARTAVFNWLYARHHRGQFILRIEDTDLERSKPEFTENIQTGLRWLGLDWDEGPFFQTQRLPFYRQAIQKLLDTGKAYRCYCTAAELEEMRDRQRAHNLAPRYDNRHRHLTPAQEEAFITEGRKAVVRFIIHDDQSIVWSDQIRGQVEWQGSDLGGDMVIARQPEGEAEIFGQPLYNLAVVVDDIDMGITQVIRGEDHIANTAKQILLYEALGAKVPEFAHTPLILNQEGKKLSKRDGVTSINEFRQLGFLPEALANYMTLLGWTPPDSGQEIFTLQEAASHFSLERVNKAGAKFDWDKLDWLNSQYLHRLAVDELTDLLIPYWQAAGYGDELQDRAWLESLARLIRPSLTRLGDGPAESQLLWGEQITLDLAAEQQLAQDGAREVLEAIVAFLQTGAPLTAETAKNKINEVTKTLGLKKGVVMKSLRAGLMGTLQGPDLLESWLLLHGKGWAQKRLQQALASLSS